MNNFVVSIESADLQTFTSFSITAEPEDGSPGNFQLISDASGAGAQFKPNDSNFNTITERDNSPKQRVIFFWTAPSAPGQNCVIFK